jgi:hypothetical protein
MPDELQAGMLAYSGFWNLMKWYLNPKKFNTKESKNKADLQAKFDFIKFKYIENNQVNNQFKDGFYKQILSSELLDQLKLYE